MYTEGYLIDIVEEGSWKDAKVEGSQTSEKVIVMRKTLIIKDKIDRILKLECDKTEKLKINEYYNFFYENGKATNVYQDKKLINEMCSEENIIKSDEGIDFLEGTMIISIFTIFMLGVGAVLIDIPLLLILKYFILSDVVFNNFVKDYHIPMLICSTIMTIFVFYWGTDKIEKKEIQKNNNIIENFRNEIDKELQERKNIKINVKDNYINK